MRRKNVGRLFGVLCAVLLLTIMSAAGGLEMKEPEKEADSIVSKIENCSYLHNPVVLKNTGLNALPSSSPMQNENEHKDESVNADDNLTRRSGEKKEEGEADNAAGKADPGEIPNEIFEESFEDLPEDALAETTISVTDVMDEIDIKGPEQIIYLKSITGANSEAMLQMENGAYTALLSTKGTTIVQIKYRSNDGEIKTYIKKINYVRPEGDTPEEKRPLINTNIKDQGIYNQPVLNFDIWVTDYRGKPLAYSDMSVTVNGKEADYIGEMGRQTYSTELDNGANTIRIRVQDEYQYTVVKEYTVFYEAGTGEITISLEAGTIGIKYLVEPKKIKVESGIPLSHVLDEYLKSEGFEYSYTGNLDDGFYLSKIKKKNLIKGFKIPEDLARIIVEDELIFDEKGYESLDTLGEFDFCQGSGWMYSINGLYSSYGFNKAFVQDGDVVRIRFTLAYGKDIGGYKAAGGAFGKIEDYGKEW